MTTVVTPFVEYADNVMQLRYAQVVSGRRERWEDIAHRVVTHVMTVKEMDSIRGVRDSIEQNIVNRQFVPGGRILAQAGREYHQTDNCFCVQAEDTREGWADLCHKCTLMFMSGGGVGVEYGQLREYGSPLHRSGGISSGPVPLIHLVDAIAASVRQGGERRGACYASLPWYHHDVSQFITMKVEERQLPHTNISVRFDKTFLGFMALHEENVNKLWKQTLYHACKYGDPGFQFDDDGQILRNACSEIITADDSDSCCIGSINFASIQDLQLLYEVTYNAVLFLLCNTLYTDKPTEKVKQVKEKNRRLGLGIMGLGEWFIQRRLGYGETYCDIGKWLETWKNASNDAARDWSYSLGINKPIAVRAIAPTGTISIVGGHTTPGIEPVFHTAYKRTYNTLKTEQYQNGYRSEIVIDPIVQKWVELGYNVEDIDTAYTLSQSIRGIEKRIAFQAYCQQFVDNAISSTVNLPQYIEGIEDKISPILLKYLPQLRGITFYPDGRHQHQPVQPVRLSQAEILQQYESCKGDSCGL